MSMILGLTTVTDATIARLLADPPLVWRILAPGDHEEREAEARPPARSWLARIFGSAPSAPGPPRGPDALPLAPGEGRQMDLDKAWHGIHFLLTGRADGGDKPAGFLLHGGREVGDVDVGYGPARALTSADTRAAHAMLAARSDDALRARFDPKAMMRAEVYPEIWDGDDADDDALGYLMENVASLRTFLAAAADEGLGLLITLQ